ncbi:UNVERIFIED_CONTAM: hypothetical protein GTU68_012469 [Idotea baltica]|nr:hypothetical protein [Idotea baltica]
MLPYFKARFGNAASRTHRYGWEAEQAVKMARESIADLIGAVPEEIVFTSGATESDNLALKGVAEMYVRKGDHIVTIATEHKAVLDCCVYLEQIGKRVTYLPVNADGLVSLEALEAAITDQTILVSVMWGNNETGVVQPMQAIAEVVHRKGALLMCDATQALGKVPVDVQSTGIDLMAFTAHKMYGPKGIGALYVRRRNPRVVLTPQIHGGGHEQAEALVMALRHLAVATGSACTSASIAPSHVLHAMGLGDDEAYASLRFSLGRFTTEEEIDAAIGHVKRAIEELRSRNPQWKLRKD